ncbi:MAG: DUF4397 domain-containing protein [Pseudomonadota bacterium]|nr:DUF4397 domain-containing protein [Pseudomonadota bacterium]
MRNFKLWATGAMAISAALLIAGCGGKSSTSSASVRLLNATVSHANLSLLVNSNSVVGPVPTDTVSNFVNADSGSPALQINDAGTGTALVTTSPSLASSQHYAVVAYESGGTLRTAVIQEDNAAPASGTAALRIFDAATDAGAVDVYVTDPTTNLSTISSPTFSFGAATQAQSGAFLSFAPGTYRVRVVGAGNIADVRLDIPAVVLASQQLATVFLTPTTGGTLANGGVLLQQGTFAASRNTNARVRLAAAVTSGAAVSVSAGASAVATNVVAPTVTAYTTVPAGAALNISVNGASVAAPATQLTAGSDSTLLVYGSAAAPSVNLIADDNHVPTAASNYKIRLLNGLNATVAGPPPPLTMDVNFAVVASNVPAGSASPYAVIGASTSTQLEVFSPTKVTPLYTSAASTTPLAIPGGAVFTLFIFGDVNSPVSVLRKDR